MIYDKLQESLVPISAEHFLYIGADCYSLSELIEKAREHFGPDIDFDELRIGVEHFHARCIGYDLYDGGDYDDYITIARV